jgi:putative glutamate/gamma-aminobutyrate antiporter
MDTGTSVQTDKPKLSRAATIGLGTLAIMNVTAVVTLYGLPAEATYGVTSVFYYIFAAIFFLIPVSIVAAELATGWPEKGGIFRWVGEAFGPHLAFVAIFLMWIETTIFLPTALTFAGVAFAYIGPNHVWDQALAGNSLYMIVAVLGVFWLATFATMRGIKSAAALAKWGGIIGVIIPSAILILLAIAYLCSGRPWQIHFAAKDLVPHFDDLHSLVLAAGIFLFYAGMEMNAIHVKEMKNPSRDYPIAIALSSLMTVVIFVMGTLAVAIIIPATQINLTQSLLIAYDNFFLAFGLPWLSPVIAVALACGVVGCVTVWVAGPSAALAVVGSAGYLPPFFQKTNKNGVASRILILQALIVTCLATMFVVMPSVQAAYQILSQLAVTLYLMIYLMMFSSAIVLRYSQPQRPRPYKIPFGAAGIWIFGGAGLFGSLVAFVLSFVPPSQISIGSPATYVTILIAGDLICIAVPLAIYALRRPHWKTAEGIAQFEPFTWEAKAETTPAAVASAPPVLTPHSS